MLFVRWLPPTTHPNSPLPAIHQLRIATLITYLSIPAHHDYDHDHDRPPLIDPLTHQRLSYTLGSSLYLSLTDRSQATRGEYEDRSTPNPPNDQPFP